MSLSWLYSSRNAKTGDRKPGGGGLEASNLIYFILKVKEGEMGNNNENIWDKHHVNTDWKKRLAKLLDELHCAMNSYSKNLKSYMWQSI